MLGQYPLGIGAEREDLLGQFLIGFHKARAMLIQDEVIQY